MRSLNSSNLLHALSLGKYGRGDLEMRCIESIGCFTGLEDIGLSTCVCTVESFFFFFYSRKCTGWGSEGVKYKVACMCFSAINGSGPTYLSELLHVYTPSRTLHSSSDTRMLKIQQYKRKTHGFRTFSCFGPHIWNSLPQDLRHCSTLLSFKAKLKTSAFHSIFIPTNISTKISATVSVECLQLVMHLVDERVLLLILKVLFGICQSLRVCCYSLDCELNDTRRSTPSHFALKYYFSVTF